MRGNRILAFLMMLGAVVLSACGGGYQVPTSTTTCTTNCTTPGPQPAAISLVTSNSQLQSSASGASAGVTISAIVTDASNNLLANIPVSFNASGGAVQVTQGTTDSTGTALAILTTGGDKSDQTITITATAGNISNAVNVFEVGSQVSVSGPNVLGLGVTQNYTVQLLDSAGQPIANSEVDVATAVNPVTVASGTTQVGTGTSNKVSATTNGSGQAVFQIAGNTAGADSLTATALGISTKLSITVSVNELSFISPSPSSGGQVKFNQTATLAVQLRDQSGSGQNGQTIGFVTDRGTLTSGGTTAKSVSATTATNGSNAGVAEVTFVSDGSEGSGAVNITVTAPDGTSVNLNLTLVATQPNSISLQANPATVSVNGTSTLTAQVLDANSNPVPNIKVDFSVVSDKSGGGLKSGASAITNQAGQAVVTYTGGSVSSGANGVDISAEVDSDTSINTSPGGDALLTVAGQALFIKLGASDLLSSYTPPGGLAPTDYQIPYTVIVQDAAGNPAPQNTVVTFTLFSEQFQMGDWEVASTGAAKGDWAPVYTIIPPAVNAGSFGCNNEDTNHDGIIETSDDIYVDSGQAHSNLLYPGNVATVTPSVTLDATGSAAFVITYPKAYAEWLQVHLYATTNVSGTQYYADQLFTLPVLLDDVDAPPAAPPGVDFGGGDYGSPYGRFVTCANASDNSYPGP